MNFFLNSIWLIRCFAVRRLVMLLLGRKFDPQGPSTVAVAPGVEDAPAPHDLSHHASSKARIAVSLLCPGMALVSFIFSLFAVLELAAKPERVHQIIQFTWLAGWTSQRNRTRWRSLPPTGGSCWIR